MIAFNFDSTSTQHNTICLYLYSMMRISRMILAYSGWSRCILHTDTRRILCTISSLRIHFNLHARFLWHWFFFTSRVIYVSCYIFYGTVSFRSGYLKMPRDLSMGVGKEYIKNRFRLHRNVNDDLNCETIDFSHFSLSTSALLFAHSAYFTKLPISCRKKIQPQPIYYMCT